MIDMNLICNTEVTMPGQSGKCECRRDMRWNTQEGECQIYMDQDCTQFTYDTQPSPTILAAVARAQAEIGSQTAQQADPTGMVGTETYQETLSNSLLRFMPETATDLELREAFCRDIDAYSYEFDEPAVRPPLVGGPSVTAAPTLSPRQIVVVNAGGPRGPSPGISTATGKPSGCDHVPQTACAVAYDSHDCDGGFRLVIPSGAEMRFRWFTSTYSYRNDIDLIGVRAGCVFTGYSDSSFNGNRMTMRAPDMVDRWEVLGDSVEFRHMDEDIESVQCVCRGVQG